MLFIQNGLSFVKLESLQSTRTTMAANNGIHKVCTERDPISGKCKLCDKNYFYLNVGSYREQNGIKKYNQQPYYLCTVTCCDSANCVNSSAEVLAKSGAMIKLIKSPCSTSPEPRMNTVVVNGKDDCTICNQKQIPQNPGVEIACESHIIENEAQLPNDSCMFKDSSHLRPNGVNVKAKAPNGISNPIKPVLRNESLNRGPRLQIFANNDKTRLHSPEVSSTSPLGNSSYTDYTETYTPLCTSANSNRSESSAHFKFNVERKPSPFNADYQFYFTPNVDNHGFFRKAVPALPLPVAVLLCILNLILPGSGTLLASFTIVFGSQTEYGPGRGFQAFLICFTSALLQFATAIFVFGWVWSIMWGIVFIKNSLRYGERRDIHTISLC